MLGLTVSPNLSWKPNIQLIVKSASARNSFQMSTLLHMRAIYSIHIKAWFDFVLIIAHMCGGSSLDRVDSKAFRLINAPDLTTQLLSLKLCSDVTSLSTYINNISVVARRSLFIVYLVLKTGDEVLNQLLLLVNLFRSLPPSYRSI